MNRTHIFSIRAIFIIAILAFVSIGTSHKAAAQETFDVKAVSATDDNKASEFPLTYSIEYSDGSLQDVTIDAEGTTTLTSPAGAGEPVAVIFGGIRYVVSSNNVLCIHLAGGGCWCLCLQWVRIWPWWLYPRWFWYFNPCC